jgi:hypothetical protein
MRIKANPGRAPRSISPEIARAIKPAKQSAAKLQQRVGRFEIYCVLEAIYRVYADWRRRGIAKRSARELADELPIARRKGRSPIRLLIEALLPNADFKQKSRWVRALEYLSSHHIPANKFREFVGTHGGLAGCAHLAAHVNRKRSRPSGDWDDDD